MADIITPTQNDHDALAAELVSLQRRVDSLRSELDRISPDSSPAANGRRAADSSTSRRRLLHLAGASAVGALGGAVASGRPVVAADPNDVVKNVPNPVSDTTTLDGTFAGPVLSLFNRSDAASARALYAYTEGASPSVRADNNAPSGAIGVAGNAPAGVDLWAIGSGRIAMDEHAFGGGNQYAPGELHQSDGTLYAMVTDSVRRVLAAPGAAGSLFPIDPIRVYDSRRPTPFLGPIGSGQQRTIAVDDARNPETGDVVRPGVVPADATAIAYNVTVVRTSGRGFLTVTPETDLTPPSSTINWWTDDLVLANSSIVALGGDTNVSVYCGGTGATDFIIDVLGFYR